MGNRIDAIVAAWDDYHDWIYSNRGAMVSRAHAHNRRNRSQPKKYKAYSGIIAAYPDGSARRFDSVPEVAREFGVSDTCVYGWITGRHHNRDGVTFRPVGSADGRGPNCRAVTARYPDGSVERYDTVAEAVRASGVSAPTIKSCIMGRRPVYGRGIRFEVAA
jgi:hypothetical protein